MPLSEEQNLMRASCRAFVDDAVIPFIRQNWQREWQMTPEDRLPKCILEGADTIGIRTLGVPEEFGGIELEPGSEVQTFALISEEIARGDSGLADKLVQNWKVSVLLRNLAPRHLQEKWFRRLVEDPQFLLAHCLTEPRGASDRWLPYNVPEAAMQTRAVKNGDTWVINGRKQFISNGYDASLYVVYANTNPKVGMLQGTSSFLVPRDTPGLTVARCNETLGCRFMNNGELVFDDMRVPEDHLLVENDSLGKAGIYFRPGKIIQASKKPRRRRARLRGHIRLCAELRPGRAHPDQAPGRRAAPRRHGDAHRGSSRAARPRRTGGRRQRSRRRHAVQHGEGVRLGRDLQGGAARDGIARRQRRDA